jgi:hypothetical protein
MSLVSIDSVDVVDPVAPFLSPFIFDIVFECFQPLKEGFFNIFFSSVF